MNSHDDTKTKGSYLSPSIREPSMRISRVPQRRSWCEPGRCSRRSFVSLSKAEIWTPSRMMFVTLAAAPSIMIRVALSGATATPPTPPPAPPPTAPIPWPQRTIFLRRLKTILSEPCPQHMIIWPSFMERLSALSPPCTPGLIPLQANLMAGCVTRSPDLLLPPEYQLTVCVKSLFTVSHRLGPTHTSA